MFYTCHVYLALIILCHSRFSLSGKVVYYIVKMDVALPEKHVMAD